MKNMKQLVIAVLLSAALSVSAGCSSSDERVDKVTPASVASAQDLSTPDAAVLSYLSAVSLAYVTGDSEVASQTMTPEEGVRVDAYIQYNVQQNRGIEQTLVSLKVVRASEEGTRAVVTAAEDWTYRYFTPDGGRYIGSELSASYDTTYTLVHEARGWVVDTVEAGPHGEVQ